MSSSLTYRIDFFEKAAPYYDLFLDILTFGMYGRFLRRAVEILAPKKGEKILDLCSGTGRAASWMAQRVGKEGEVIGMDVAKRMVKVAMNRYVRFEKLTFLQKDVTESWDYQSHFDGIFTSFSLHELPEEERCEILEQSYLALKERGRMVIADFNPQISGRGKIFPLIFFKIFERENLNFFSFGQRKVLEKVGFKRVKVFPMVGGLFQITCAQKD
jgi:ubiquinone/menaquinone biosynthesis C-methylase UbiE